MLYSYQYIFMILLMSLSDLLVMGVVKDAPAAAYIPGLSAGVVSVFVQAAFIKKGGGITSSAEAAFGRGGMAASGLLCGWFVFSAGCILAFYADYTVKTVLEGVPTLLLILPMSFVAVYAATRTGETLGRMAVLLGSVMIVAAVVALVLALGKGNLRRLGSLEGATDIKYFGAIWALQFGDIFAVAAFLPKLAKDKGAFKKTILPVIAGGVFTALFAAARIMLSGYESGAAFIPAERSGDILQTVGGIKLLSTCAYFLSVIFRLCVVIRISADCSAHSFLKKRPSWSAAVCAAIMAGIAFAVSGDVEETSGFIISVYPVAAAVFTVLLPLTGLAFIYIKGRKTENRA